MLLLLFCLVDYSWSFEYLLEDLYLVIILWYFLLFLHKNICCGYSLEVLLMSTHNIQF